MLIMFKVIVEAAGTPGPLLGDGTNTTVTMLYPSALTDALDTLGSMQSVINSATRRDYSVARLHLVGIAGNSAAVSWGARDSAIADMIRVEAPAAATNSSNAAPGTPLGFGDRNDINLADIDVDSAENGEGLIVVAEVR